MCVDLPLYCFQIRLNACHCICTCDEAERQLSRIRQAHHSSRELRRITALPPVHTRPCFDCLRGALRVVLDMQLRPDC